MAAMTCCDGRWNKWSDVVLLKSDIAMKSIPTYGLLSHCKSAGGCNDCTIAREARDRRGSEELLTLAGSKSPGGPEHRLLATLAAKSRAEVAIPVQ